MSDISSCTSSIRSSTTTTTTPRRKSKSNFWFKLHVYVVVVCLVIISVSHGVRTIHKFPPEREDLSHRPPQLKIHQNNHNQKQQKQQQKIQENDKNNNNNDDQVDVWEQAAEQQRLRNVAKLKLEQEQLQQRLTSQRTSAIHMLYQSAAKSKYQSIQKNANNNFNNKIMRQMGKTAGSSPARKTVTFHRKYSKILYFVHIHKSAGSLMCHLAYQNRLSAEYLKNCNVQVDQRCCGNDDSLVAQQTFANSSFWDFVAIERDMYDAMDTTNYDYLVTLRDSKSRYYSHWNHLRRLIPVGPGKQVGGFGTSKWLTGPPLNRSVEIGGAAGNIPEPAVDLAPGEDPLGNFSTWSQGQPDNWNVRIICGPKCRMQPKFAITPESFRFTLDRVSRFSQVMFVEDMEASYNMFAMKYGWYLYNQSRAMGEHANVRHAKRQELLKNETWNPLMSALDDALYEMCRYQFFDQHNNKNDRNRLGENTDVVSLFWGNFSNQNVVDEYFAKGPGYHCLDGCCGKCSNY